MSLRVDLMPERSSWMTSQSQEEPAATSTRAERSWLKQATTRSALSRLGIRSSVLAGQMASVVLFAVFWRHGA